MRSLKDRIGPEGFLKSAMQALAVIAVRAHGVAHEIWDDEAWKYSPAKMQTAAQLVKVASRMYDSVKYLRARS